MENKYRQYTSADIDYEVFEKLCYDLAKESKNPNYAKECLDGAKTINEIERLYKDGYILDEAFYLLTY